MLEEAVREVLVGIRLVWRQLLPSISGAGNRLFLLLLFNFSTATKLAAAILAGKLVRVALGSTEPPRTLSTSSAVQQSFCQASSSK